jgi:hypothetical protein
MAKLALTAKLSEETKNADAFCPNAANGSFAYIGKRVVCMKASLTLASGVADI